MVIFLHDLRAVSKLSNECQSKSKELSIIRRRISWVIGKWVVVKASKSTRPVIYQILLTLLDADQDIVVRLAAVIFF